MKDSKVFFKVSFMLKYYSVVVLVYFANSISYANTQIPQSRCDLPAESGIRLLLL